MTSGVSRRRASGFAALLAVSASFLPCPGSEPAFAQDLGNPKYRLQSRPGPDREEGIKPLERSGAYLDLVGAFLETPAVPGRDGPQEFRLGFYLPERERNVRIEVRDYDRFQREKYHYWMVPAQTVFDGGFQQFAWDASVARELGIRLDDLGAVVLVGGHGERVVAPLLLATAPFPASIRAQGVRFVFVPNETMTVEYTVHPKGTPSVVLLRRTGEQWTKGQRMPVRWPGLGPDRQPANEGPYVLRLTVIVTTPQGFTDPFPFDHTFHYRPVVGR
jgi:hypothetical protein